MSDFERDFKRSWVVRETERRNAAEAWLYVHMTDEEQSEFSLLLSNVYRGPETKEQREERANSIYAKAVGRAAAHAGLDPTEHRKFMDLWIEGERIRNSGRRMTEEEHNRLMEINSYQDQHRNFDPETATLGPWKIRSSDST